MPSNLDVTEAGEVHFTTAELGKWRYLVFGLGKKCDWGSNCQN
jgi:hypothetical protein